MVAAVEEKGFRPGMVSVVQTFGERAKFHPHVHAPYVDEGAAESLFRHKVLALLRRRGLLSQDRIELRNSWRRSGFSVHNRVFVHPRVRREFEAFVRYMMRPAVSLSRLHFTRPPLRTRHPRMQQYRTDRTEPPYGAGGPS